MNLKNVRYFGPKAQEKSKKILRKLRHKRYMPGVYILVLSENEHNLLDVYKATNLALPGYSVNSMNIIGIALGKSEAYELVRVIVDEVYQMSGNCDIKKYFMNKGL